MIDQEFVDINTRKVSKEFIELLRTSGVVDHHFPYSVPSFFNPSAYSEWIIENLAGIWGIYGIYVYFQDLDNAIKFENQWTVKNPKFYTISIKDNEEEKEVDEWIKINNISVEEVGRWRSYLDITVVYEISDDDNGMLFKLRWG